MSLTSKIKLSRSELTGIVLAGGQSSRMGREKGLVEFRGRPLVQYSIDLLSHFAGRIVISTANPEYGSFGLEMIADEVAGQGPAAGLASSLKSSTTPWNLVVACDLPFLAPELIELLLANRASYQAVVPVHQGKAEPLAGLYHRDLAAHFKAAVTTGHRALHRILQTCPTAYPDAGRLVEKYPHLFANFNTLREIDDFL